MHYLESNSARSGQVARRATAGKATRQVSCLVKETLGMSLVESLGELLPMSSRRVKPSHPCTDSIRERREPLMLVYIFLCYLLTKETRILTHLETIMNFTLLYHHTTHTTSHCPERASQRRTVSSIVSIYIPSTAHFHRDNLTFHADTTDCRNGEVLFTDPTTSGYMGRCYRVQGYE
jgi:hypothetical protein